MPGSKTSYLEFCADHSVPLHFQPWWLDALSGPDHWDAAIATGRSGRPEAVLPWYATRRWGIRVLQQPPFSAYAGPWLAPPLPGLPAHERLGREHRLLRALIDQLPRRTFFHQNFRPEIQNGLPFFWAGFRQTLRYTYVLPAPIRLPEVYARLKGSIRTDLRRASETVQIVAAPDAADLYRLHQLSLQHKGRRPNAKAETFQRLFLALRLRAQGQGWLAFSAGEGQPCAGLFLAFDTRQAAIVLAGRTNQPQHTGALNALYWNAIEFCAARQLSLDFEGSMDPGIERVFRGFGGEMHPYFRIRGFLVSG
ncbi:MAG: GNAT family N-acetyltransferase [Saprospiraceae bacterium]|nr:GNAT family N-acetyltransferase [Saprospiraceae bacterium]